MEIKPLKEESYESISKYLDEILRCVNELNDLTFIDYEGDRYLVSHQDNRIAFVLNNGKSLEVMFLEDIINNEVSKIVYGDDLYTREITKTDKCLDILKKKNNSYDIERLVYIDDVKNSRMLFLPVTYIEKAIEYVQYLESNYTALTLRYGVTDRDSFESAIGYSMFHVPDAIMSDTYTRVHFIPHTINYTFALDREKNIYYKQRFNLFGIPVGKVKLEKTPKCVLEEITSGLNMNDNISSELVSILDGTNKKYKTLNLIKNEYNNYLKKDIKR